MGINIEELNLIEKYIKKKSKDKIRMIELGNQVIIPFDLKSTGRVAKHYFESIGIEHISMDLNGEDGALTYNFDHDIKDYNNWADLVTNSGTLEHVNNQYMAFKNMHNFCSIGGYMIHVLPPTGFWHGHCDYFYTEEFFKNLAEKNDYDILDLYEYYRPGNENLFHCVFRKNKESFIEENEFNILKQKYIKSK